MELKNKKVLIVGFERTGEALCRFLHDHGARIVVTEKKALSHLGDTAAEWKKKKVRFEAGGHNRKTFLDVDLIIPSPGVPPLPEIKAAAKKGIPVISEIELACRFLKGKIIAITGSNGKSTTATLTHKILREAGQKAHLAGNIGTPLISFVAKSKPDHTYVTEVSSFQLAYVDQFKPDISVFLNISENHLDWHGSFVKYFRAKKNLFRNLFPEDVIILNRDQPPVWDLAKESEARLYAFSRTRKVARGCYREKGWIILRDGRQEMLMPISRIPLPGPHNHENVMAAALVGRLSGVSLAAIRKSVKAFRGLEHRLEDVCTIEGIRFVNDSKATTVDATLKALASFNQKIVLILGGRDKGGDFRPLRQAVKAKVRHVLLIGEAGEKIASALGRVVSQEEVSSYPEAVRRAFLQATSGDIVLLAPACTSWDMFKNFEERGRVFKREVRRLAAKIERDKG